MVNVYPVKVHIIMVTEMEKANFVIKEIRDDIPDFTPEEIQQHIDMDEVAFKVTASPDLLTWYCRLGHANFHAIYELAKGSATGIDLDTSESEIPHLFNSCEACIFGKQHRLPFKDS